MILKIYLNSINKFKFKINKSQVNNFNKKLCQINLKYFKKFLEYKHQIGYINLELNKKNKNNKNWNKLKKLIKINKKLI